jgi:outer membrane protein TolC
MRHCLARVVYGVLCCLGLASLVDGARLDVAAQAAPPASAPATPPSAAAAAPAISPAGAAAAPSDGPSASPSETGGFDLIEALRGTGRPYSSAQAAQRAVETAPSVAKAEAAARKAEAAAELANVALYPRVELEARYTRLSNFTVPAELRTFIRPQLNAGLLQARLAWPVSSLFLTLMPRHEAAMKAADAQKLQIRAEQMTVSLRAREAYYNYARTRAARMVAVAALAQAEAHRRDSDALVNAGSIARVELVRADAQVAQAKVALARAEFAVQSARSALVTIVHGKGDVNDITVSENLEVELPGPTQDENALYALALKRRSEIKSLSTLMEAQQRTISAYKGAQLPVIAIGGTAEQANPNQRVFGSYNEWRGTWAAQVNLVWSPNDTMSARAQVDSASADLAQTQADLGSLQDALRIEVSQAFNGWAAAHASLEAAQAGITSAEESYRVRREQFRAGAAIAVDVLDAEAQLRQARLDLVNSLIDTRIAKARVDRAIEVDGY